MRDPLSGSTGRPDLVTTTENEESRDSSKVSISRFAQSPVTRHRQCQLIRSTKMTLNRILAIALLVLCSLLVDSAVAAEKRVVCYYTNWSAYRQGPAKFLPDNINPYLCTHLVYAFGGLTSDSGIKPFDKYQDVDKGKNIGFFSRLALPPKILLRLCSFKMQVDIPSSMA